MNASSTCMTDASLKKMKQEWESLSQGSTKLDEFISLVSSKARSMKMVKIPVSDHDKAVALVQGLSKDYDWLKNHFSMMAKANYSFADVATAALKFAKCNRRDRRISPTYPNRFLSLTRSLVYCSPTIIYVVVRARYADARQPTTPKYSRKCAPEQ
jgi:hypothetical protein